MVNRLKLNEKALRDAEPKPGISYQVFDTEVIGFAARIQASGARTFTIDYRHAGRQRRMAPLRLLILVDCSRQVYAAAAERKDARVLLLVIDARRPVRRAQREDSDRRVTP